MAEKIEVLSEASIRAALAREVTKLRRQEAALEATKATVQLWTDKLNEITRKGR